MSPRSVAPIPLAALLVAMSACADMKDLLSLQRALAHEVHGEIGVHLNADAGGSRVLTVVVENSPDAQTPDQQAGLARRIGELVRDRYPGYSRLTKLTVSFAEGSGGGLVRTSTVRGTYHFTREDLGVPAVRPLPAKGVKRAAQRAVRARPRRGHASRLARGS